MNNFLPSLLLTTLAGLSTLIGYFVIFIKIEQKEKFLSFIFSFSTSIMLVISIFDLIPSGLVNLDVNHAFIGILIFSFIFFISKIIFYILDYLMLKKNNSSLYSIGFISCVSLILHNIPEGILTFSSSYIDFSLGFKLSIMIALHNIPEGISISVPIYYATKEKGRALLMVLIASLSEPLAGVISYLFFSDLITTSLISVLMFFAGSIMIYLSIFKLWPESCKYKEKKSSYIGLLIGIIIALITIKI